MINTTIAHHPPLAQCEVSRNDGAVLSDEAMSPEQQTILQGMTPGQRWSAARQLYWTMRRHKAAYLKSQHPDWSDDRIRQEVHDIFLNARS